MEKSKSAGSKGSSLRIAAAIAAVIAAAAFGPVTAAQASDGLELAKKSGCLVCHDVDKKLIGPAWRKVANKYRGQKEMTAMIDGSELKGEPQKVLQQKVAKGGKGNWNAETGGVAMIANSPKVSDQDIATLVTFVLSLPEK